MPFNSSLSNRYVIGSKAFPANLSVSTDGILEKEVSVAAAKTGTLTTRTDANTGELTMAAGHGITTGDRLDLYWTGGSRRGITVGTVASNAVPIDLGSGDDLPSTSTAITAMVPHFEDFVVTGDNVKSMVLYSSIAGQIVLVDSYDAEVLAVSTGAASGWEQCYGWIYGNGVSNPLAGEYPAGVYFSHGDSANAALMGAIVGVN